MADVPKTTKHAKMVDALKTTDRQRFRWWLWWKVTRLPWVCPALAHGRIIWRIRADGVRIDAMCRSDYERNGVCWCGKLRGQADG